MTASACARSSAWPRTTTTVASPRAGTSSVGQERGDRPVVAGRGAGRARPCSTKYGRATSRPAPKNRPRRVSTPLGLDRDRGEGRPGPERVPGVLEEQGVEGRVAADLERPGVLGLGGQDDLEVGGDPEPPGPVADRFRTVSR